MPLNNPLPGGSTLVVAETNVFDGTCPTAWTDLDLSSVVGLKDSLAILKVKIPVASEMVAFRKNGDIDEHFDAGGYDAGGCAFVATRAGVIHFIVVVATDNVGKVEWRGTNAVANSTVDIIAYVN